MAPAFIISSSFEPLKMRKSIDISLLSHVRVKIELENCLQYCTTFDHHLTACRRLIYPKIHFCVETPSTGMKIHMNRSIQSHWSRKNEGCLCVWARVCLWSASKIMMLPSVRGKLNFVICSRVAYHRRKSQNNKIHTGISNFSHQPIFCKCLHNFASGPACVSEMERDWVRECVS